MAVVLIMIIIRNGVCSTKVIVVVVMVVIWVLTIMVTLLVMAMMVSRVDNSVTGNTVMSRVINGPLSTSLGMMKLSVPRAQVIVSLTRMVV